MVGRVASIESGGSATSNHRHVSLHSSHGFRMAASNAHFSRLRNFVHLQLPAGFPAKIEIPLFHVVSARITFSKVNEPGSLVDVAEDGTISIADSTFEVRSVLDGSGRSPRIIE